LGGTIIFNWFCKNCKIKAPNKACTRRWGFCVHLKQFSSLSIFPGGRRSAARPSAGNANRLDCRISNFSKIIFEKWERNAKKHLVLGVPHNILAIFWH
jgi:hypothetical protein